MQDLRQTASTNVSMLRLSADTSRGCIFSVDQVLALVPAPPLS